MRRKFAAQLSARTNQTALSTEEISYSETALQGAALMNFLDEDIIDCVVAYLGDSHFYKTMPAQRVPGLMQDVYKIRYEGERVYLKLQVGKSGHAVVVAFKADESVT
jgi:hypothetical protein